MVLEVPPMESIFRTSIDNGEGLGSDRQQNVIVNTKRDFMPAQASELNNALNVLEVQQHAAITPTALPSMEIDVFTDSTGYLNKVDTTTTTAGFSTDKYTNGEALDKWLCPSTTGTKTGPITVTCTAIKKGYISTLICSASTTATYRADIIQGGTTLATKSMSLTTGATTQVFVVADYSAMINPGTFTIVFTRTSGTGNFSYKSAQTYNGTSFSFSNQEVNAYGTNTQYCIQYTTEGGTNQLVQTTAIACSAGIKNFQVLAYRNTLTGTGTITCDVSLDNGAHYKTGLPLNSIIDWSLVSNNIIIKFNLNAGASAGTAEFKGFGIQYWTEVIN